MFRTALAAYSLALAVVLGGGSTKAETKEPLVFVFVAKTATCACCSAWIEHLEENGFAIEAENFWSGELVRYKLDNGIPGPLMSCHTGMVEGYTIEGHVPAGDIQKLLEERPDAVGLAVPGMPLGSPGMDFGDEHEAYDVLLVRKDGSSEVFSSYPAD